MSADLLYAERIWRRHLRSMIRSPTARLSIRSGSIPKRNHKPNWGLCFSVSAFRIRQWHGAMRPSRRLGSWLIFRLWLNSLVGDTRLLSLIGDNTALEK